RAATTGPRLQVTVRDEEGRPLESAGLAITRLKRPEARMLYSPEPFAGVSPGQLQTGPDGAATVPIELGSRYCAHAEAAGFAPAWSAWVEASDGKDPAAITLGLRRLCTATGVVLDAERRPVANARVFQTREGPRPTEARTDAEGRFSLADLRSG